MDSQASLFLQERLLKEATETMHKETTETMFKETTVKKETLAKTFTSPEISKTPEPVNEIKSVSHQKSARL